MQARMPCRLSWKGFAAGSKDDAVNAMLLNEFLKQHRKVEAQETKLQELTRKLEAQNARHAELDNGRLNGAGGGAVSGPHDFVFRLYSTLAGGTPLASVTNLNVAVANGLFTTSVDFGPGYFNGTMYWLEIAARNSGGGTFTTLNPRQPLSPTSHASYAVLAGTMQNGSVTSSKLANDSVTTPAITDNAVTAPKIASGHNTHFYFPERFGRFVPLRI